MKVLYDYQIFSWQKYGGISRYFCELIRELTKNYSDIDYELPLLFSNNHYLEEIKLTDYKNFFSDKNFRGKARLFNLFNKINSIVKIHKKSFDIFHPTYYDPYFLKYIGDKPFVLTVHDMIHEKFQEMFSKRDKTSYQKKILVEKSRKIIAVSENTKKDLIDIFGVNESKIEVIYHGNSMYINNDQVFNFELPSEYLLFVGSRGGYKNFNRFIRSINMLLKDDESLFVVCVGGGQFNELEKQLFLELGINKRILQYDLDDKTLSYFYKKAIAFVFPSLYEGFGIPILEAFACGCPVVCSNISSLPEIAGDGAYYFDPYSEDSIKDSVRKVLENPYLRKQLVFNGCERLKQFSWQKTAEKTKKIYDSIL